MTQPQILIAVDSYVGAFIAIGFMIPLAIASLAAGYILAGFVLNRIGRTILGIHVRHWLTRNAPSKFFLDDSSDRRFVERVLLESIERNRARLKDLLRG